MVELWCKRCNLALNIKNAEVERLAAEVAEMARETKTEAIRKALEDRKARLQLVGSPEGKIQRVKRYLETEVWPFLPPGVRGKGISREEQDEILGIGPNGYPE